MADPRVEGNPIRESLPSIPPVGSAHIINGTARNALLAEVFTDKGTGTMISA